MRSAPYVGRVANALACLAALSCLTLAVDWRADAAPLPKSSPLYNPGATRLDENPEVSADYKGTIEYLLEAPALEAGGRGEVRKAKLEWDESVTGPVDQIEYTGIYGSSSIHWHMNKFEGEVKDEVTEGSTLTFCKGKFATTPSPTVDAGEQGVFLPLDEPGHPATGGNPATNPDYSVRPPGGMPVLHLTSSAPAGTPCETNSWNGTGSTTWGNAVAFASTEPAVGTEWGDTVNPTVYFPPGGGHTQSLPFKYPCMPPKCGPETNAKGEHVGSVTVTVESSITFSSPGLSSGAPSTKKTPPGARELRPGAPIVCGPGSKPTCEDKKLAQEDIRGQLPGLANECAIATIGIGGLVAGAVAPEVGVAVVLAAEGPTGAVVFALSAPLCGLLINRIYKDAKIIEDPPAGALRRLARPVIPRGPAARLPSCRSYTGKMRRFCDSLRTDGLRYAAAVRKATAIDTALLTTVDRVSGAYKAHNVSALKLQEAQAASLRAQFKAAHAEQRRAGAAIRRLIKSVGLGVRLTAAQEQSGITRAFSGLSRLGVSGARAQTLAGLTLAAAPTDALAQLSR
jgi:hypothetical protein